MIFTDIHVNKSKRFSLGIEEESGRYYLSIAVSNPYVDYEEYYEIISELVHNYPSNLKAIEEIITECKAHKNDNNLFFPPGKHRGVAS